MNLEEKNGLKKSKKPVGTIVWYVAIAIIALMGAVLMINNILLYTSAVAQYVAQGYPKADVVKQLLTSQLLPGIFEPLAIYGGIALVLFYIGMVNEKVSKCLALLTPVVISDESVMSELAIVDDKIQVTEPIENEDEYNEPVNTNP